MNYEICKPDHNSKATIDYEEGVVKNRYKIVGEARKINSIWNATLCINFLRCLRIYQNLKRKCLGWSEIKC